MLDKTIRNEKRAYSISCKPFFYLVRPEGFEPPAYGFEERHTAT